MNNEQPNPSAGTRAEMSTIPSGTAGADSLGRNVSAPICTCCTCGYQWPERTDGSHSCATVLRKERDEAMQILHYELDRDLDEKDTLRSLVVVAVNALHYVRKPNAGDVPRAPTA